MLSNFSQQWWQITGGYDNNNHVGTGDGLFEHMRCGDFGWKDVVYVWQVLSIGAMRIDFVGNTGSVALKSHIQ